MHLCSGRHDVDDSVDEEKLADGGEGGLRDGGAPGATADFDEDESTASEDEDDEDRGFRRRRPGKKVAAGRGKAGGAVTRHRGATAAVAAAAAGGDEPDSDTEAAAAAAGTTRRRQVSVAACLRRQLRHTTMHRVCPHWCACRLQVRGRAAAARTLFDAISTGATNVTTVAARVLDEATVRGGWQ